ncbi:MAG: ATP-binding protein [Desulfocucumaceae bacterium]
MKTKENLQWYLVKIKGLSIYNFFTAAGTGKTIFDIFSLKQSARLYRELACWSESSETPRVGNLWQNFLLDQIIFSDNTFTRMASGGQLTKDNTLAESVTAAAGEDLKVLKAALAVDFNYLFNGADDSFYTDLIGKDLTDTGPKEPWTNPDLTIFEFKKLLLSINDSNTLTEALSHFHLQHGCGIFCRYHAFRWDGKQRELIGINEPDPILLGNLVGYEKERGQVLHNTERLIYGLPSGNLLLYGDRGTGKSSTVKALVHKYGPSGLRIIEIPKLYLTDYQYLLSLLRKTRLVFILFIDDLSFEEHETEYKILKSILEGSLEARPHNVVIYATSNRRHLVREFFDERQRDVNGRDTLQEKLSLSERFPVTVLFLSPDQNLYLEIIEGLARQKGLDIPPEELRTLALEWERLNNGRSGRTARQFVDQLILA